MQRVAAVSRPMTTGTSSIVKTLPLSLPAMAVSRGFIAVVSVSWEASLRAQVYASGVSGAIKTIRRLRRLLLKVKRSLSPQQSGLGTQHSGLSTQYSVLRSEVNSRVLKNNLRNLRILLRATYLNR